MGEADRACTCKSVLIIFPQEQQAHPSQKTTEYIHEY